MNKQIEDSYERERWRRERGERDSFPQIDMIL